MELKEDGHSAETGARQENPLHGVERVRQPGTRQLPNQRCGIHYMELKGQYYTSSHLPPPHLLRIHYMELKEKAGVKPEDVNIVESITWS